MKVTSQVSAAGHYIEIQDEHGSMSIRSERQRGSSPHDYTIFPHHRRHLYSEACDIRRLK